MAKPPQTKTANYDPADVPPEQTHFHVPLTTYYKVFGGLMVLLILTLAAAALDLGEWNIVIAMVIALAKAVMVVLYFMHVKYSSKLVKVFAGAAFYWLAVMFILILSDYTSRGWIPLPGR